MLGLFRRGRSWRGAACIGQGKVVLPVFAVSPDQITFTTGEYVEVPIELEAVAAAIASLKARGNPRKRYRLGAAKDPTPARFGVRRDSELERNQVMEATFSQSGGRSHLYIYPGKGKDAFDLLDTPGELDPVLVAKLLLEEYWRRNADSAESAQQSQDPLPVTGFKTGWVVAGGLGGGEMIQRLRLDGASERTLEEALAQVEKSPREVLVWETGLGWTEAYGQALLGWDAAKSVASLTEAVRSLSEFGAAFACGTDRVIGYGHWILARGGRVERCYAYLAERGETLADEGDVTEQERSLGLAEPDEEPDEQAVVDLTDAWLPLLGAAPSSGGKEKVWVARAPKNLFGA